MKSVKRAAVARRRRREDPVRLSRTIRAFSRISRLDLGTAPPHDTGEKLLREVCRALDLKRAEIWLIGPNDHRLWRFATHGSGHLLADRMFQKHVIASDPRQHIAL